MKKTNLERDKNRKKEETYINFFKGKDFKWKFLIPSGSRNLLKLKEARWLLQAADCWNPQTDREENDQGRMLSRFAMEEESSSDSGSSNGDEAAEEIEEDEMAMDLAQVISIIYT